MAVTQFDLPGFHAQRSDGTLVGAEIELAQQIAQALGVGVQFIKDANSFDAVVDLVASGKADIGVSKLSQDLRSLAAGAVFHSLYHSAPRHAVQPRGNRAGGERAIAGSHPAEIPRAHWSDRQKCLRRVRHGKFPRRNSRRSAHLGSM